MNILTICGSLRKGSFNRTVMNTLPALAPSSMKFADAPSFALFPIYNADEQNSSGFPAAVNDLADAIRKADGVIIVSPEYNYSVPGGLKNALDWVSRLKEQPFVNKPVALMSASGGPIGGARMQYHMRQIMVFLNARVFNTPEIFIASAQTKISDKGELTDETTKDFIKKQLAAFETFVAKMK
jgi:chromate reductase